jgi:amino acid adenylation domain-containing protein
MRLEQLVIDGAAQWPDSLAVSAADGALTYRELDARADQVAAELRRLGVVSGDRVALWLDKSAYAVAVMQAVLRLGAAYVPLDPHIPARRADMFLSDCAPSALVTTQDRITQISGVLTSASPLPVLIACDHGSASNLVFRGQPAPAGSCRQRPAKHVRADSEKLAYILYTSGSTGEPKGVCVSHRSALAFIEWAGDLLRVTGKDRLANHAPFQFDLSVFDLYAAFRAGASVHIVPSGTSARGLVDVLLRESISIWYSVPSALVLMIEHGGLLDTDDLPLRAVIFAGEVFPIGHLKVLRARWPQLTLLNFYGPTETNVCTFHNVAAIPAERNRPVPIGTAACGNRVWALRPDGRTATAGEEGELIVAGPTVMMGYYGRAPLQNHRYATGDIVRVLADGSFEFVGRRDHLVKVRGNRVEIGEIESVLLSHPDIADAAVVVVGQGHRARLCACIVTRDRPLSLIAVKRFLAGRLPRYMVVDSIRRLTLMPRTSSGKVDRLRLAELTQSQKENSYG